MFTGWFDCLFMFAFDVLSCDIIDFVGFDYLVVRYLVYCLYCLVCLLFV